MPYCSRCGRELRGDELFCPGCGVVVPGKSGPSCCPRCGAEMPAGATACPNCGSVGGGISDVPRAERRRSARGVVVTKEKDEVLTIILALLMPGLGHFYVGNLFRGLLFLVVEIVAGSIALSALVITSPAGAPFPFLSVFFLMPLVVHVANIFDAYNECKLNNEAFRR